MLQRFIITWKKPNKGAFMSEDTKIEEYVINKIKDYVINLVLVFLLGCALTGGVFAIVTYLDHILETGKILK